MVAAYEPISAKQYIKIGKWHAGKLMIVVIEHTHLRVLHDGRRSLSGPVVI